MKLKTFTLLSILILFGLSGIAVCFGSNNYVPKKNVVLDIKKFMKHVDSVYPGYLPGETPDERAERLLLNGMEVVNEYLNKNNAVALPKNRFFEKRSEDITDLMCESLNQKMKKEDMELRIRVTKYLEEQKSKKSKSNGNK